MRTTVFGATGGAGRAITLELATRGHEVTAASRSIASVTLPANVRAVPTDLRDPASAAAAARGADVIVMAAQVPYSQWAAEFRPLVDAAVDAAATAGARLVMVDNLYAYGSPATPISESTPEAATTRKGVLRRDVGQRLLAANAAGPTAVSIGRFPDYYGPDAANSLVNQLGVGRVVRGKAPQAFIDANHPHSFSYLPDAARAFATLVERPEADGRVWILPCAPAVTQRQLLGQLAELAGLPPKVRTITPTMLRLAGVFNPELREAREVIAQFDRPYLVDSTQFERAFGHFEVTPHRDALTATLAAARGGAVQSSAPALR
ncbi:MAG: NAD(P)H-binding protein [Actinomycetota bacterium]|jgi:nucleoside-diphosphate-sugar epimerase|nr:NAD(P)H-binding protein [Actinomycetota bacterium]